MLSKQEKLGISQWELAQTTLNEIFEKVVMND